MDILIEQLPEVTIMGEKYQIQYENSDKVVDEMKDKITNLSLDDNTLKSQSKFVKETVKEITDTLLYDGAFEKIFADYGNGIGIVSYIKFAVDLVKEVDSIYKKQIEYFEETNLELEKAKQRKENKK